MHIADEELTEDEKPKREKRKRGDLYLNAAGHALVGCVAALVAGSNLMPEIGQDLFGTYTLPGATVAACVFKSLSHSILSLIKAVENG